LPRRYGCTTSRREGWKSVVSLRVAHTCPTTVARYIRPPPFQPGTPGSSPALLRCFFLLFFLFPLLENGKAEEKEPGWSPAFPG
jgi:hypothetical protein